MIVKVTYKKAWALLLFAEAFFRSHESKAYAPFCQKVSEVIGEINAGPNRKFQLDINKEMIIRASKDAAGNVLYSPRGSKYEYMFKPDEMIALEESLEQLRVKYLSEMCEVNISSTFKEEEFALIPDVLGPKDIDTLRDLVICPCLIDPKTGLIIREIKSEIA